MVTKMFKIISKVILIIVVIHNVESKIPYHSCEDVSKLFEEGRKSFEFLDKFGEQLAKDGFLMESHHPGAGAFFVDPETNVFARDYIGSNEALFGMQYLYDEFITNAKRFERPSPTEITNFFTNVTNCISRSKRFFVNRTIVCNPLEKYRSLDGSCNNLNLPLLGTPFTAYTRKIPSQYDNYVLDIRKSIYEGNLPSPRVIVNEVYNNPLITFLPDSETPNTLWLFLAQFLVHDTSFIKNIQQKSGSPQGIRCCTSGFRRKLPHGLQHYACSPIEVPANDRFYGSKGVGCLNYVRSERMYAPSGNLEPANQLNRVTGYVDLSTTYGTSLEECNSLRAFEGGKLLTNELNILPELDPCPPGEACYMTGDLRGNQTPQLALIQSLFVRFHNLIADSLHVVNPHWNDEKLFQESRRFCIAAYQHLLFEELLPTWTSSKLGLSTTNSLYDDSIDGVISNEFTTGVMRSIHIYLPSHLLQSSADGRTTSSMSLSDSIGRSEVLQSNFSQVFNGLLSQPIRLTGMSDELTNKVFGGFDLASIDIMRGRDHGLKTYVEFRKYCGFAEITNWQSLYTVMSVENVLSLQKVYKSVKDIDLILGLELENKYNHILGPTAQCIMMDQFASLKSGDRYFYSHSNSPYPFTQAQIAVINSFTAPKFFCLVTTRFNIPERPFYIPSLTNGYLPCNKFRTIDLSAWRE